VASDARFKPYPRDPRAVVLDAANVKSWSEVRALLSESYELRKPASSPRKRAKTSAPGRRARR